MPITPINVTLPTSDPVSVPLGVCTRCGYPGPAGAKCINPQGCERVADPFAAFIGHARIEGARLMLEAVLYLMDRDTGPWEQCDVNAAIRALDPAAIVKP